METTEQEVTMDTVPSSEAEADALLEQIEGAPDPGEIAAPEPTETVPSTEQTAAEQSYKIKWGGEEKDLPLSKVLQYAQQGYDYNEKMRSYKTEAEALEEYKQVQEWAKENPDLWSAAQQAYQNSLNGVSTTNPTEVTPGANAEVDQLKAEIGTLKQTLTELQSESIERRTAQEDAALDKEIAAFKEKHSDLQWDGLNDDNLTLEGQILNYATENGISKFTPAALAYLHDQLVERAALKAKEDVGQGLKKNQKLGIAPVNSNKKTGLTEATNVSNKSYDELAEEAILELTGEI